MRNGTRLEQGLCVTGICRLPFLLGLAASAVRMGGPWAGIFCREGSLSCIGPDTADTDTRICLAVHRLLATADGWVASVHTGHGPGLTPGCQTPHMESARNARFFRSLHRAAPFIGGLSVAMVALEFTCTAVQMLSALGNSSLFGLHPKHGIAWTIPDLRHGAYCS